MVITPSRSVSVGPIFSIAPVLALGSGCTSSPDEATVTAQPEGPVIDGELHFKSNPTDEPSGNALVPWVDGQVEERIRTSEWLQFVEKLR